MRILPLLLTLLISLAPNHLVAQEQVAVVPLAPYTQLDEDGQWSGPAIDLIRAAGDRSGTDISFTAIEPTAIERTAAGGAIAVLPVYASERLDEGTVRSLPIDSDIIGLLGDAGGSPTFLSSLAQLFNPGFLKVVGGVALLLLMVGAIFWFAERKDNDAVGGEDRSRTSGIGMGFWWAGVTATTIGYGDTVPKTRPGRIIAMIWMLFSMALTAILTAYIVSLTGKAADSTSLADAVADKRVGIVAQTGLQVRLPGGVSAVRQFATLAEARASLDREEIDLIAHPYRTLVAAAGQNEATKTKDAVLYPVVLLRSDANGLRREIDRIVTSPDWQSRMGRLND